MNIHDKPELLERLSAAYALGVLRGGARRRLEAHAARYVLVQRTMAEWQDKLTPMMEFARPAIPRPEVWQAIERRIKLKTEATPAKQGMFGFLQGLAFWRGLSLASGAIAAILVAVIWLQQPQVVEGPATDYVATLSDDKSQPVVVITGDSKRHQLVAHVVARQNLANDRSLELWAVPKKGAPRSLGLVAANGTVTLPLPDNATPDSIPLLAVSLEPKGGSPSAEGPTGPILFKGAWMRI